MTLPHRCQMQNIPANLYRSPSLTRATLANKPPLTLPRKVFGWRSSSCPIPNTVLSYCPAVGWSSIPLPGLPAFVTSPAIMNGCPKRWLVSIFWLLPVLCFHACFRPFSFKLAKGMTGPSRARKFCKHRKMLK